MDFFGIRLRVIIALVLSNLWIGYWIIAVAENTSLWYWNFLFSKIIFTNEPLLWFLNRQGDRKVKKQTSDMQLQVVKLEIE